MACGCRWRKEWAAWLLVVAAMGAGCRVTVTPPRQVADPVVVYIADQALHASLVLPREDGGELVEFAYGEWEWFALSRDEWWRAAGVALLPHQGTLGRRPWTTVGSAEELRGLMAARSVKAMTVERMKVLALIQRLDIRYDSARATEVYNPECGMWFVHDPDAYSASHHCNMVVSEWLRELGAQTAGWTWTGEFVVRP